MSQPTLDELFERRLTYPDFAFKERLDRLIGLDEYKARLTKMLGLLVNPRHLRDWVGKHHPHASRLVSLVTSRPPLVILAGDVGSGKTELAETIGDAVARQEQQPRAAAWAARPDDHARRQGRPHLRHRRGRRSGVHDAGQGRHPARSRG